MSGFEGAAASDTLTVEGVCEPLRLFFHIRRKLTEYRPKSRLPWIVLYQVFVYAVGLRKVLPPLVTSSGDPNCKVREQWANFT